MLYSFFESWSDNSFDICAYRRDLFCRLDKFALLKFLLGFIFAISVLQLIFQRIYTYWNESMTASFIKLFIIHNTAQI